MLINYVVNLKFNLGCLVTNPITEEQAAGIILQDSVTIDGCPLATNQIAMIVPINRYTRDEIQKKLGHRTLHRLKVEGTFTTQAFKSLPQSDEESNMETRGHGTGGTSRSLGLDPESNPRNLPSK